MAKIDADLHRQLQAEPNRSVNLIIRTDSDPGPYLPWFESAGLTVKQTFRLTPGLAVSCPGSEALKLLEQDWVVSVELDQPVQAM